MFFILIFSPSLHLTISWICHNTPLCPVSLSLSPFDLLIDIRLDGCQSSARLHQRDRSPKGKEPEKRETASCAALCSLKVPQLRPSTKGKQLICTRRLGFVRCVCGHMRVCAMRLHAWLWMQKGVLSICAHKWECEWVCVCDCTVHVYYCLLMSLSKSVCECVWAHMNVPVLHPSRLTLTLFLIPKLLSFYLFVMLRAGQ